MKMRYIKQSNEHLTYGKVYAVVDYWGNFRDYIVIDDKGNKYTTFKHYFEDEIF